MARGPTTLGWTRGPPGESNPRAQLFAHQVFEVAHRVHPSNEIDLRNRSRPRAACVFTAPGEQASTAAMSASVRVRALKRF